MRREATYKVSDRIDVYICAGGDLSSALDAFGDYIRRETLTESLIISTVDEVKDKEKWDLWKEQEMEGRRLLIGVKKHR